MFYNNNNKADTSL